MLVKNSLKFTWRSNGFITVICWKAKKKTSKDKEKKERRERQLSNHLIVSKMEYICIINNNVLYPPFYLFLFSEHSVINSRYNYRCVLPPKWFLVATPVFTLLSCLWPWMCFGGLGRCRQCAETGAGWYWQTMCPWVFVPALIRHDVALMLVLSPEWTLYSREGE